MNPQRKPFRSSAADHPWPEWYPAVRGPLDGERIWCHDMPPMNDEQVSHETHWAAHIYRFDALRHAWIYRGAVGLEKWRQFVCDRNTK